MRPPPRPDAHDRWALRWLGGAVAFIVLVLAILGGASGAVPHRQETAFMDVCKNPLSRPNGRPLIVRHPDTGRPFPDGVFTLTEADLANPNILRLLPRAPRGVAGGVFGDLVPVPLTDEEAAAQVVNMEDDKRAGERVIVDDIMRIIPDLVPGDFTKGGHPKVAVLEDRLGYSVTEEDAAYAWQEYEKTILANAEPADAAPDAD